MAPTPPTEAVPVDGKVVRTGVLAGVGAYAMWGAFPLYFPLLEPAGAAEILVHRILWSLVVCLLVVTAMRRWGVVRAALRTPSARLLPAAAFFIAVNWLVYVWAVNSAQVVETALGYYVNPLVTVMLGVLVLRERLRRAQWAALGVGVAAVVVLTVDYGRPP